MALLNIGFLARLGVLLVGLALIPGGAWAQGGDSGGGGDGGGLLGVDTGGPAARSAGCVSALAGAVTPAVSADGRAITASFVPAGGRTLAMAAAACGVAGFDWEQQFVTLPVNPFNATLSTSTSFRIALLDPVAGSYTYKLKCSADGSTRSGAVNNAYPFYYDPNGAASDCGSLRYHETASQLNFYDSPADPCLIGGTGVGCNGQQAPAGSFLGFYTLLVGYNGQDQIVYLPVKLGNGAFRWTDTDNGNGTGGITVLDAVAPVPEPRSAMLLVLPCAMLMLERCWRRRS